MAHTNPTGPMANVTGEPRQLLFLALCSLALVLAAFAAPPTAQGVSPPDLFGNESEDPVECTVVLSEKPVPDENVTVTVRRSHEPVEGVRVWFEDESIGVTNESGRVDGTVPYVRNLRVTVGLQGGETCEFVTGTATVGGDRPSAAVEAGPGQSASLASIGGEGAPERPAQSTESENATGQYDVHSTVDLDVIGDANPGEDVTIVATLDGDPVPDATVSVDGEELGRTDADGRYTLTIPDDGQSSVTVRVQRGEIAQRTNIDVRLLRVGVRGENRFSLPGQSATVTAAIGTDPVEGATVTLGGERVGTTDALGQTEITLPVDPTTTVTVTSEDRTDSTSLLGVFAPTIAAAAGLLILFVGFPLALYWAGGRKALLGLFGLFANLLTGAAGYAVAGRDGALFAVGSTILLLLLVLFVRRPRLAREAGDSTSHAVELGVDRLTASVLWFTRGIEILIDQAAASLGDAVAHVRAFDLALTLAALQAWVVALPGRFKLGVLALVYAPGRLLAWLRSKGSSDDSDLAPVGADQQSTGRTPGPAIRELWRTFARRVVPARWPQRTPGEVSRQAIDAGFPRDSVVELTDVFRDVEYGGEALSEQHLQQARTAFDALGVDDGDGSGADGGEDGRGSGASGPDDDPGPGTDDGEVSGS